MTLNDLAQQCTDDSRAWFPTIRQRPLDWQPIDYEIDHHLKSLAGEVGEVLNLWKKFERGTQTREETIAKLRDELADVFTYFMGLPIIVGFDLQEEYDVKREYNQRRFGRSATDQSAKTNGAFADHLPTLGNVSQ